MGRGFAWAPVADASVAGGFGVGAPVMSVPDMAAPTFAAAPAGVAAPPAGAAGLAEDLCPLCDKHCPLSAPSCRKGRAYAASRAAGGDA